MRPKKKLVGFLNMQSGKVTPVRARNLRVGEILIVKVHGGEQFRLCCNNRYELTVTRADGPLAIEPSVANQITLKAATQ